MNLFDKLYKGIMIICCAFLVLMVFAVTIAVVGRYVFNYTPTWSEGSALFCMTWIGLLSSSLAEYTGTHIRITTIDTFIKGRGRFVLEIFYDVVKLFFAGVLVVYGFRLAKSTWVGIMGAMPISVGWLVLAAPVAGMTTFVFIVANIIKKIWSAHE